MRTKANVLSVFLLIVLATVLFSACESSTPEISSSSTTSAVTYDKVELVYFHRAQRCSGCIYAETATRYTVDNYFKDAIASGKLEFKVIDLSDETNTAIVKKYGAYTSSLFINGIKDGVDRIEEVDKIWFLLGKDAEFVSLVKGTIEKYLDKDS